MTYRLIICILFCMLILFKKEKKDKQRTGTSLINSGLLTEIGLEYVVALPYQQLESCRVIMGTFNWTAKFREKLKRKFNWAKALHRDSWHLSHEKLLKAQHYHLDLSFNGRYHNKKKKGHDHPLAYTFIYCGLLWASHCHWGGKQPYGYKGYKYFTEVK